MSSALDWTVLPPDRKESAGLYFPDKLHAYASPAFYSMIAFFKRAEGGYAV